MPAANPDLKEAVLNLVIDHGYAGVINAVASLVEDDYQLDIERRTISKRSGKQAVLSLDEARMWIEEG